MSEVVVADDDAPIEAGARGRDDRGYLGRMMAVVVDHRHAAGLPEDLLNHSAVRLEAASFYRFWDSLSTEVADPLLPIRLCRAVRSEAFSPPIFAALCSPNFQVAVQRIAASPAASAC